MAFLQTTLIRNGGKHEGNCFLLFENTKSSEEELNWDEMGVLREENIGGAKAREIALMGDVLSTHQTKIRPGIIQYRYYA